MTGISSAKQVTVSEVPENLHAFLKAGSLLIRLIGEETVITLETENTDSATVEIKMVEKFLLCHWLTISLQFQQPLIQELWSGE